MSLFETFRAILRASCLAVAAASVAPVAGEPSASKKDPPLSASSTHVGASSGDAVVEPQIEIRTRIIALDGEPNFFEPTSAGPADPFPFTLKGPPVPVRDSGTFAIQGVFTDPQFQVVVRALNQKNGVDILSLPTVTVRNGSRATVALTKNLKYATDFKAGESGKPAQPTSFAEQPIGWSFEVEPITGSDARSLVLTIGIEHNAFEKWQNDGPGVRQPIVEHNKCTSSVTIWDGQTVCLTGSAFVNDPASISKMDEDNPPAARKRNLIIFVTAKCVDAEGSPAASREKNNGGTRAPEAHREDAPLNHPP